MIVWTATGMLAQPVRLLVAGDGFFGVYLVLMAVLETRATPEDMRRRASFEDEGIILIVLITLTAISLSIGSIFALLEPERSKCLQGRKRQRGTSAPSVDLKGAANDKTWLMATDSQQILEGRQAKGMQLDELMGAMPEAWKEQRQAVTLTNS